MADTPTPNNNFLPDFCGLPVIFAAVIIAELCAFVLAFAPMHLSYLQRWQSLGITSMFVQWLTLSSCAVLCLSKTWLKRMNNRQAALSAWGIILLVIVVISEAAYWLFISKTVQFNISHDHFLLRNVFIGAIVSGPILRYFYIQYQWRQQVKSESSARLQALQARIRPHFLFNSMNTIASLTRSHPEQAETAVENLADLFRASMNEKRLHRWRDERLLCERYLEIETMRLGERLQVKWDVQGVPDDALLPPLLVQPLLENAIYHGIEPLAAGGCIQLRGQFDSTMIHLSISNPLATGNPSRHQGNQLALANTRERLSTLFGTQAKLVPRQTDTEYSIELTLPYRNKDEDFNR